MLYHFYIHRFIKIKLFKIFSIDFVVKKSDYINKNIFEPIKSTWKIFVNIFKTLQIIYLLYFHKHKTKAQKPKTQIEISYTHVLHIRPQIKPTQQKIGELSTAFRLVIKIH